MVGYFDESEQSGVSFCLAGWFAPIDHWRPFEDRWRAVLSDEGITSEFKMRDCFSGEGAFKTWRDRAKRQHVADSLLGVTVDHPLLMPTGYVVGFDLSAFERIVAPRLKSAPGFPRYDRAWLWAFQIVMAELIGAQRYATGMVGVSERIRVFFDSQKQFAGRALGLIEQAKRDDPEIRDVLGPVAFADSQQHPGIQMADLLAWEARRAISEFLQTGHAPTREQWRRIARARRPDNGPRVIQYVWDEQRLAERVSAGQ